MSRINRDLSDKELHQRYIDSVSNSEMSRWLYADEVNELYMQGLKARPNKKAAVFWPVGGDRLAVEQIEQLVLELKDNIDTLFLPLGTGYHWDFVVLQKDSQGNWQAFRVDTPGDGLCGMHTAKQSMEVLDKGLSAYTQAHPGTVHALSASSAIQPQIQKVLKAVNSPKTDSSAGGDTNVVADTHAGSNLVAGVQSFRQVEAQALQREEAELQKAVKQSLKIQRMSPFDYKLAKLAEYEALGYGVENLCLELTQMLVEMAPDNRAAAVNRLRLSGLAGKPSIERIIKNSEPADAAATVKLSANCNILRPMPKANKVYEQGLDVRSSIKLECRPKT